MTECAPDGDAQMRDLETARSRAAHRADGAGARRFHFRSCRSSRTLRRADFHAFALELHPQFARKFDGAGCITVDTNRFAAHLDIATFDGAHLAFAQHSQDTLGGLFWVVEQRIWSRARHKPSVIE